MVRGDKQVTFEVWGPSYVTSWDRAKVTHLPPSHLAHRHHLHQSPSAPGHRLVAPLEPPIRLLHHRDVVPVSRRRSEAAALNLEPQEGASLSTLFQGGKSPSGLTTAPLLLSAPASNIQVSAGQSPPVPLSPTPLPESTSLSLHVPPPPPLILPFVNPNSDPSCPFLPHCPLQQPPMHQSSFLTTLPPLSLHSSLPPFANSAFCQP